MKKILDEKGRLFGVINIVDIIVILLALVIIAGVFVKYSQNERTNSASADLQTVTYRMELNTVREGIANNLRAGDYIYDQDKRRSAGHDNGRAGI